MNMRNLLRHETILAMLVVLALIVLAGQSDKFFTLDNILNQGRLMTEVGLIAVIMTFVIITGGIDLSVGSILGLVAILIGVFWKNMGLPLPLAIGLGLVVGTFAGFGANRHTGLHQCFDISIDSAQAQFETRSNFLCFYNTLSLKMNKNCCQAIDSIHENEISKQKRRHEPPFL